MNDLRGAFGAISEIREYFEDRQDADCDQDGFIPNKEMQMLSEVETVERALKALSAPVGDAGRLGPAALHVAHDPAAKPSEGGE